MPVAGENHVLGERRDKTWRREAPSSLWGGNGICRSLFGVQEAERACCLQTGEAGGGKRSKKNQGSPGEVQPPAAANQGV